MAKVWDEMLNAPDVNNKYYVTKRGGGYSDAIPGNAKTNKEKNRPTPYFVLPNCVGHANARSKMIAKDPNLAVPSCDAAYFPQMSKWKRGKTPELGAIAVWKGNTYGHVAIVERLYSDGSYLISESGWTSFYFRTRRIYKDNYYGAGLVFDTFLYNPKASKNFIDKPDEKTSFLPAKGYWGFGDKDARVGKLAEFMYKMFPAYTDKRALGDYYGYYLQASIKNFQARVGEAQVGKADGYCGPRTYEALKKYGFKE